MLMDSAVPIIPFLEWSSWYFSYYRQLFVGFSFYASEKPTKNKFQFYLLSEGSTEDPEQDGHQEFSFRQKWCFSGKNLV